MWFSSGRSRFGCSNTNGMPSRPSQKSIELCLSAPTRVTWWTAWAWIVRMSVLYQLRLVVAAFEGSERHELDARLNNQYSADPLTDGVREARVVPLHHDRKRRLLLDARLGRLDADVAAHVRVELAHDFANRRRKDVDAAHDQHVVGAPDAANARATAAAGARARLDQHVVAGSEAQKRSRSVFQVRQDQLAAGAVVDRDRRGRVGVDQLRMDKAL